MAAHAAAGVIHQEGFDEYLQGVLLPLGTGIGRVTAGVESAFVADTDAMGVVVAGVSALLAFRTAGIDHAILRNVIVVTDGVETTGLVAGF